MEHYSIQAIDIFISEIVYKRGWHRGDPVQYKVNNCAWESLVELQLKADDHGTFQLHGKQFFQHGDKDKMLSDKDITFMALQAHIYRQQQDNRAIHWAEEAPG